MKQNNSGNGNVAVRLAGLILLAVLWVWLVSRLVVTSGLNLRTILVAAFSGIIIFYPLWKKYLQPLMEQRRKR